MDYVALLKRAFHITIKYRALWLFGILLAIFGGGGGRVGNFSGGGSGGSEGGLSGGNLPLNNNPFAGIDPAVLIGVILIVLFLVLVLMVIGIVVRSVSRAALIGMVAKIEDGDTVSVKDGWRIGWSARAWRIFLINVIIGVPLTFLALITLAFAASPLVLLAIDHSLAPLAIVLTVIFVLIWIFVLFVLALVVSPVMELSWRFTVLREQAVLDSLRSTLSLLKHRLKDVAIAVLVMIGVGIGVAIVMFVAVILLVVLGGLGAAIPALAGYVLTKEPLVALLAGVPVFLLVVAVPMIFFSGLVVTFQSTVWTLIFNGLTAETSPELPVDESSPTVTAEPAESADESPPVESAEDTPPSPPE